MKTKKVLQGLALGVVSCSLALSMTGCGGETRDAELNPVTLAIGALDGNYNPFFYTAQNDGEVTSLTQISLITSDNDKDDKVTLVCGQDQATVALAYRETVAPDESETTYEYVIKKGIKFSDGEELTVKDVLFNLYVYLDPYYSGSSTLYSTKIKGLSQYRTQREDSSSEDDATNDFVALGSKRYEDILAWDSKDHITTDNVEEDAITVANLFMELLETTWNNSYQTASTYTEYNFKEDWEVFYYSLGYITYQRGYVEGSDTKQRLKDENGKYLMTFDNKDCDQYDVRERMDKALAGLSGAEREAEMKKKAFDEVFGTYILATYGDKDDSSKITKASPTYVGSLAEALETYVSSEALQAFTNAEMSDYYNDLREKGKLTYTNIEGIKVKKVTASTFGTNFTAGSPLDPDEEYDCLTITIDGVDPVAKYNFGITVAPMHYYSGKDEKGVDYVEKAKQNDLYGDSDEADRFGVKYADKYFFDTVMKGGKSARPVGAGSYMIRKGDASGRLEINRDCLYERNPNFYTVGTGLSNAKIKYLTYRYVSDDQIVNMLIAGNIDFGMPQSKKENVETLNQNKGNIQYNLYDTNGFGYVGINPKFVPDVTVRRAIMKAMDVASIVKDYYDNGNYASVIYRPITTNSFVYEKYLSDGKTLNTHFTEYENIKYTTSASEITTMLEAAGYTVGSDGVRAKGTQKLKYTFTIAGESTDHPAWNMFTQAADFLNNECGFDITVVTDINALQKLAMGNLAVWAAAWSSGVDPDMYQVYHKDSKASSVRNWGYDVILADQNKYPEEYDIIVNQLAPLIEEGRSKTNPDARKTTYWNAMDLVMEFAVELPTYQRKDLYAFNKNVIDGNSLNTGANGNAGPLNRIWELNYVQ